MKPRHYCTYFDRRYAAQGLALWLSLRRHDPAAVLWVLALDAATADAIRALGEESLRAVPLAELEAADRELAAARENRSWVEYVFTLSPCWPRYLLAGGAKIEMEAITYCDADLAFFASPAALWGELGAGSVLIAEHRFPPYLRHLETRGRFNVGVLCFRNDARGRAVLEDWRARCIAWCHDRVEPGRYADQKYLDAWPETFAGVVVSRRAGVNLAPWNWMNFRYGYVNVHAGEEEAAARNAGGETNVMGAGGSPERRVRDNAPYPRSLSVDGAPLVVFHFARFRPLGGRRVDSGQLEYGVMPLRLRSWIYGRYWQLLQEAAGRLAAVAPELARPVSVARGKRAAWKTLLLALAFGSTWWRVGPWWIGSGFGLGRYSGHVLMWVRGRRTGGR